MKRFVLTCMTILLTLVAGQAKDISDLFDDFKKERHADYVSVSPFMMKMAGMFASASDGGEIMQGIHSVRVLDLEECSSSVKQRFNREVNDVNVSDYEEMVRVKDEGELVRILVKQDKDIIREMVILCTGGDDCTLVALTGKIRQQDIDKIVDRQIKDDHKHGCGKL